MPLALDPSQTFKVILKSDRSKTNPPAFEFRYLTNREWKKFAAICDSISDSSDGIDGLTKIEDAVRVALVGWENMGQYEYDPSKLEDIINPGEAKELLEEMTAKIEPTEDELGK